MKKELSLGRLMLEGVIVAILGTGLLAIMYTDAFHACCTKIGVAMSILYTPSMVFAWLVGGGPHGATRDLYYASAFLQFLIGWPLLRLLVNWRYRRPGETDDQR